MAGLSSLLKADLLRLRTPSAGPPRQLWRTALNPRFYPVLILRLARACFVRPWLRPLAPLLTWMNVVWFGIECTPRCEIGAGLMLPHTSGTVIGASRIGRNVTIFQGVTLGAADADLGFDVQRRPALADDVVIGAGAKVLGHLEIGQGTKIGANAVVLESVDAGCVAVGIPARIVRRAESKAST